MNGIPRPPRPIVALKAALRRTGRSSNIARLLSHDSGVAAVEFSLILPILVILWIGGVEVTGALSVDRRLNNLAASVGDLVARSKKVTHGEVDDIFDLAPGALFPYSPTGVSMRVTAVKVDKDKKAQVAWSRACLMNGSTPPVCGTPSGGKAAHPENADMNGLVPANLRIPETQLIMSEVFYTYTPAVGYVVTGDLALDDRMFFVPRLVPKVELCENPPSTTCKS